MRKLLKLGDLCVGQAGRIYGFGKMLPEYKQKLYSMGFLPGTLIKLSRVAPFGDPLELEIKGGDLCVRRDQVADIVIRLS